MRWEGKTLQPVRTKMHVTDLNLATSFTQHNNFHLNYAKVYDENAVLVDHLIELDTLASKVQALSQLISTITGKEEVDMSTIKHIAHQLQVTTDEIIDTTFHTIGKILPSTKIIYTCLVVITIIATAHVLCECTYTIALYQECMKFYFLFH